MLTATEVAPSEKSVIGFLAGREEQETTEESSFAELFSLVSSEPELSESNKDGKAVSGLVVGHLEGAGEDVELAPELAAEQASVSPAMLLDQLSSEPLSVIHSAQISSDAVTSSIGSQLQALVSQLASRDHIPKGHADVSADIESRAALKAEELISGKLTPDALADGAVTDALDIKGVVTSEVVVPKVAPLSTAFLQHDEESAVIDVEQHSGSEAGLVSSVIEAGVVQGARPDAELTLPVIEGGAEQSIRSEAEMASPVIEAGVVQSVSPESELESPVIEAGVVQNVSPEVELESSVMDVGLAPLMTEEESTVLAGIAAVDSERAEILNETPLADEPLIEVADVSEVLATPVLEAVKSENAVINTNTSSQAKVDDSMVDEVERVNLEAKLSTEQNATVNVNSATMANIAGQTGQAATQFTSVASNASSNSVTHWGAQGGDAQASQASQNAQGFGQSGQQPGQSGQGQTSQQQAMMFAQSVQEHKDRSIEQQQAVRAVEDAIAKSEAKELLGGAEIASGDRRGILPLGLQTINLPVKHPQWGQALGQRVVFMSKNDLQQAQITLNPEKLGKIQVVLQLDKDQVMNVSLTAQSGATREAIENALPRLREMLEQAGINLGSVNVSEQKQSSENDSEGSEGGKGSLNSNLAEDDSSIEDSAVVVKSTDSLVDYYV